MKNSIILFFLFLLFSSYLGAQGTQVGSGSYSTVFPGVDEANRNGTPPGTPDVTGNAATKPVSTNNWWSNFLLEDHGGNAFNYPLSFRSESNGLVVNYTWPLGDTPNEFREPMSAVDGVVVGVQNLNSGKSDVADFSDWTVTLNWNDGTHQFNAQMGMGMPFVYFTKGASDVASVFVGFNPAGVLVDGNKLLIENNFGGSNYVVYAPAGSFWSQNGDTYTSTLNGKDFWSMVLVPDGQDINIVADEYEPYAFVFPANTQVEWTYQEASSTLLSTYSVTPDVKEGTGQFVLQGLLPHQWDNLAASSPSPNGYSYQTVRGDLKMMASDHFVVEHTFSGILPALPDLGQYSDSYSPAEMFAKVDVMKSEALNTWTDSYNDGQAMNRLIQVARIADQIGHVEARDQLLLTVKARLEDWLSYENGEVAFLFYYHDQWDALLGYPAGHGQDTNLNDHHFHWGYFIHAAAAMEQFFPGWADDWGDMVNMLVRDAASPDRSDEMFPFLRSFSPFAGHCWANGFATFPFGNDQESSSESMQFNSALIHWGSVTGNDELRDLGIYLYTTEQSAIEEYWFDVHERSFRPGYAHEMVARIWGGGYDNGTFWTSDIAASYGIELYPIHGGSLYLGHHPDYVQRVWNDMTAKTDVLNNVPNDNLWYDVYWKFLSFLDSEQALQLYNAYPDRNLKFGISDAQTYHWLHNMNSLGQVRNDVLPDYPVAAAFDKDGTITYVAHNYSLQPITVSFSDGYALDVPARSMATSRDGGFSVELSASDSELPVGAAVMLTAHVTGSEVDQVEFFMDDVSQGVVSAEPYELEIQNLSAGMPSFHAEAVYGGVSELSPVVSVQVGSQVPYGGSAWAIPGEIEAGHYDVFEGGPGQGITYSDVTPWNEAGTFRPDEYVDAGTEVNEGATVGWIEAGEWLEFSVDVAQTGAYNVEIRFASESGGGPLHFSVDGTKVSPDVQLAATGGWGTWASLTIENVQLTQGEQIIRVVFENGGFNLGKMNFVFDGEFTGNHAPVANAGGDISLQLPGNSVTLNGSASSDEDGTVVSYNWIQVDGPDGAVIDDENAVQTEVTGLVEGTYTFRLTVTDNEGATDTDDLMIVVSPDGGTNPGGVCEGTDESGDFSWIAQEDGDQVTLTFVPELEGAGDNIVLLYYTTNPNNVYPGYIIEPNVPAVLNVSEGEEVYFYFTYSHPAGGERNTADRIASFTAGSCSVTAGLFNPMDKTTDINVWPNPFSNELFVAVSGTKRADNIRIFSLSGQLMFEQSATDSQIKMELGVLPAGTYVMMVLQDGEILTTKLFKK